MPANEFEKQVQEKLDDFQLNPSATVWKNVEEQIRQKKRRRVIIIFFLSSAALLLLGYFAYNLFGPNQKTEMVQQPGSPKNEKSLTDDKNNSTANDKDNSTVNDKNNISTEIKETKEQSAVAQPQDNGKQNNIAQKETKQQTKNNQAVNNSLDVSVKNPSPARKNRNVTKHDDEITASQKKPSVSPIIKKDDAEAKQEITVTNPSTQKLPVTNNETKSNVSTDKDNQKDVAVTKVVEPVKIDSVKANEVVATNEKKDVPAKKKNFISRMKWGVDVSAGITSNQGELFALLKSGTADAYNNPLSSGSLTNTPGTSTANIIAPPSDIKPAGAFKIGVIGEMKISERSSLSTGLQYSYASNKIKVGYEAGPVPILQQNAGVLYLRNNSVYRGPQKNNYINRYHFVSVPLEYHWQINKSKKLPVVWNAGIAFKYLLSTNALIYSPSYAGIYYKDKSAVNKVHFNLSSGLSFRFTNKRSRELLIGPEVYFDTRKLVDNRYNANHYLLFGGVNAKLFFNKKEK